MTHYEGTVGSKEQVEYELRKDRHKDNIKFANKLLGIIVLLHVSLLYPRTSKKAAGSSTAVLGPH